MSRRGLIRKNTLDHRSQYHRHQVLREEVAEAEEEALCCVYHLP